MKSFHNAHIDSVYSTESMFIMASTRAAPHYAKSTPTHGTSEAIMYMDVTQKEQKRRLRVRRPARRHESNQSRLG
jgi:hypothetical protein